MKNFLFFTKMTVYNSFLFYSLIISIKCIIPNWNLDKLGNKLINSSNVTYNYTTIYKNFDDNLILQITKEIYIENDTIKNRSKIKINNEITYVPFDLIESFYNIKEHIIICPKGTYHPYNLSNKNWIIPKNFENAPNKIWDLKCKKHKSDTYQGLVDFFLVFYLMNDNEKFTYLVLGETTWGSMNDIANIIYDLKLEKNNYIYGKKGEYPLMALIKKENYLFLQGKILVLKKDMKTSYEENASHVNITSAKKHTQAFFNINTNTYYFISYDDIYNFISGYYITTNTAIAVNGFSDWYPENNIISPFEFLEEEVEVEEINFILYNQFVYYKIRNKNNNNKIYHGILDIILNKIVFNTDETIIEFIPFSNISMLAITPTNAYKICIYKDNEGNCIEKCNNNEYKLDVDSNICSQNINCEEGKLLLIPSQVCIEKCDESIYIQNNTHCGLCRDFPINGKEYKLINGTNCIEFNRNSMEYFNERLKLLKCKDGFILKENDCIPDLNCYELCEEKKCTQSSSDKNNQFCTECRRYFFLHEGNCNTSCPERFQADNATKTCIVCKDINCDKYIYNTCNCTKCNEKYFLNSENICENCPENCSFCKNSSICEKCINGYFINKKGVCSPCPLDNCKSLEDDKCQCKICKEGYFKNIDKCQKCDINCQSCSVNETNCTSCIIGKYLTTENKCEICNERCLTCDSNQKNVNDICLSCKINPDSVYKYLVNDEFNKTCVENCTTVGREFNEDYTCKPKKNETEKKKEETKPNNGNNHLLIILGIIFGVILLVIIIIIIKICCFDKKKNKALYSEEINSNLNEVNELSIN